MFNICSPKWSPGVRCPWSARVSSSGIICISMFSTCSHNSCLLHFIFSTKIYPMVPTQPRVAMIQSTTMWYTWVREWSTSMTLILRMSHSLCRKKSTGRSPYTLFKLPSNCKNLELIFPRDLHRNLGRGDDVLISPCSCTCGGNVDVTPCCVSWCLGVASGGPQGVVAPLFSPSPAVAKRNARFLVNFLLVSVTFVYSSLLSRQVWTTCLGAFPQGSWHRTTWHWSWAAEIDH